MSADGGASFFVRGKFLHLGREENEHLGVWKERVKFIISGIYANLNLEYLMKLSKFHAKKVAFGCSYSSKIEKELETVINSFNKTG